MSVNSERAREYVVDCLLSGLTPFLKGSPGIGKSAIMKDVAREFNLKLIDQRLSQSDPTDLNGFPRIDGDTASYVPFDTFPTEDFDLPVNPQLLETNLQAALDANQITQAEIDAKGGAYAKIEQDSLYDGWLLFLDEINSAPLMVQASAYKLVLDKEVGQRKLHANVLTACAGNLESDGAIVNTLSTAMKSRLIHIPMHTDHELWDKWAVTASISYQIRDYVKWKKDEGLNNFDPESTDDTFGCERTWEFADKLIKQWGGNVPDSKIQLLVGTLGSGLAQEFVNFLKVYKEIPDITTIVANPKGTAVPVEPSHKFAVCGVIGAGADSNNIAAVMDYVQRLDLEFQIIALKDVIKTDPVLASDPAMKSWITANMNSLF